MLERRSTYQTHAIGRDGRPNHYHTRFQRQNQLHILHVRQDQSLHTCNDSVNTKRQCQNVKRVL